MKRPPDDSIVIFMFVVIIIYYITLMFILKYHKYEMDVDGNTNIMFLLVGIVSGWLGGKKINNNKK